MKVRAPFISLLSGVILLAPAAQAQGTGGWQDELFKLNYTRGDVDRLSRDKVLLGNEKYRQIFTPYIESKLPVFITSDSLLNAYNRLLEDSMQKESRLENGLKEIPRDIEDQYKSCLDALKRKEKGQPAFMAKHAWEVKTRQTILAAQAQELHRDARSARLNMDLQSAATRPQGVVEPVPEFFAQMSKLAAMSKEKFKDVLKRARYDESGLVAEIERAKQVAKTNDLVLRHQFNALTPAQADLLSNPVLLMVCISVRSDEPMNKLVAAELPKVESSSSDPIVKSCLKTDEYKRFYDAITHSFAKPGSDLAAFRAVAANTQRVKELSGNPNVRPVVQAAIANLEGGNNQRKHDMIAGLSEAQQEITSGNWQKSAEDEFKLHYINSGLRSAIKAMLDPEDTEGDYDSLCITSRKLQEMATKELNGVEFTKADADFVAAYGKVLARAMFYKGNSYGLPYDDAMRVVAMSAHKKIAVGRPQAIYVLYPQGDAEVLTVGAVMPYYEIQGTAKLTDAEWRKQLDEAAPPSPVWLKPLMSSRK